MARIACPECHAESLPHSWFTTRRRREVACRECGAKAEIVIPAVPYYTVTIGTSLIATIVPMTWLLWVPFVFS